MPGIAALAAGELKSMHWTTIAAFFSLDLVLCFIPGPAVMAVVGAALGRSRTGFATALGILTGNFIYFVVSAFGVASILLASHRAFVIIKWCGAAYLAFLGIRALFASGPDINQSAWHKANPTHLVRGWLSGTVTQLANPKALVFFAAILPQFIDPRVNLTLQIVVLGAISLLVELGVLSTYIVAADNIGRRGINRASHTLAERVGGAFLLGVAAMVLRESR